MEILQQYIPRVFDVWDIRTDLRKMFPDSPVHVFTPVINENAYKYDTLANHWHQDIPKEGGPPFEGDIGLWSNITPSQIRKVGSEEIYVPECWEIVRFNNVEYEHRINPEHGPNRWFVRILFLDNVEKGDILPI